jgi:putative ATP-dependent endonuclease of OLD family
MRLSRIIIKNFRNFKSLFALRLILDPSLPDSARRLRLDDLALVQILRYAR